MHNEKTKGGRINFDELVSAAQDYMEKRYFFSRKYPNGGYISHENPELYDDYRSLDRAERVLTVAGYVTEIPSAVLIQANRIINRVYDRAFAQDRNPGYIDSERVVMTLLANT